MDNLVGGKVGGKTKMPTTKIDEILTRMMEATDTSSRKGLCEFLGLNEQAVQQVKRRGNIPSKWFIIVSERTGHLVEWLRHGTGPKKSDQYAYRPGLGIGDVSGTISELDVCLLTEALKVAQAVIITRGKGVNLSQIADLAAHLYRQFTIGVATGNKVQMLKEVGKIMVEEIEAKLSEPAD